MVAVSKAVLMAPTSILEEARACLKSVETSPRELPATAATCDSSCRSAAALACEAAAAASTSAGERPAAFALSRARRRRGKAPASAFVLS